MVNWGERLGHLDTVHRCMHLSHPRSVFARLNYCCATDALLAAVQTCQQLLENRADVCAIFSISKRYLTVFLMCP